MKLLTLNLHLWAEDDQINKLKKIAKLTHVEALEIVAKISGWKNWRSVKIDNEVDARQLIDEEKRRKEMIGIKKEYKRYLQQNS